jgi:hypothetical protein
MAYKIISPGGTIIIKAFTMYTKQTYELLSAAVLGFNKFYIVKPKTSKEDNSECYWVGVGYKNTKPPPVKNPYLRSALNIATALTIRQKNKIIRNINSFNNKEIFDFTKSVDEWIVHNIVCKNFDPII